MNMKKGLRYPCVEAKVAVVEKEPTPANGQLHQPSASKVATLQAATMFATAEMEKDLLSPLTTIKTPPTSNVVPLPTSSKPSLPTVDTAIEKTTVLDKDLEKSAAKDRRTGKNVKDVQLRSSTRNKRKSTEDSSGAVKVAGGETGKARSPTATDPEGIEPLVKKTRPSSTTGVVRRDKRTGPVEDNSGHKQKKVDDLLN